MGNTIRSLFPPSFTSEKHEASAFPLSDLSLNFSKFRVASRAETRYDFAIRAKCLNELRLRNHVRLPYRYKFSWGGLRQFYAMHLAFVFTC